MSPISSKLGICLSLLSLYLSTSTFSLFIPLFHLFCSSISSPIYSSLFLSPLIPLSLFIPLSIYPLSSLQYIPFSLFLSIFLSLSLFLYVFPFSNSFTCCLLSPTHISLSIFSSLALIIVRSSLSSGFRTLSQSFFLSLPSLSVSHTLSLSNNR